MIQTIIVDGPLGRGQITVALRGDVAWIARWKAIAAACDNCAPEEQANVWVLCEAAVLAEVTAEDLLIASRRMRPDQSSLPKGAGGKR